MLIYVHGNCQAMALGAMIQETYNHLNINSYEVFNTKIIEEIDNYYFLVKNADIILSQPIHDGYRGRNDLSLNWIRDNAKSTAEIIVYPSMHFEGQLVGLRALPNTSYEMPYQDVLLLHLFYSGCSTSNIKEIILSKDLYSKSFVQNEINISLDETKNREISDSIDIIISPFIIENVWNEQLFHVINHPRRITLAFIANQIMIRLGYEAKVSLKGTDYLWFPHVPCHPSIKRFFSDQNSLASLCDDEDLDNYRLRQFSVTQYNYLIQSLRHLTSFSQKEIVNSLRSPSARHFLERLAKEIPSIPNIEIWNNIA